MLGLQGLQLLCIRHFHAVKLGTPFIKGRVANAVLAAQILSAKPSLVLFQNADDLFFCEP